MNMMPLSQATSVFSDCQVYHVCVPLCLYKCYMLVCECVHVWLCEHLQVVGGAPCSRYWGRTSFLDTFPCFLTYIQILYTYFKNPNSNHH